MKALIGFLVLLIALAGAYVLAFLGIIPIKGLAKSSPSAAKALTAMHLYKPAKAAPHAVAAAPAEDPLADERAALQSERAQLAKEKAALEKRLSAPAAPRASVSTSPKVAAIFDTMSPEDLARIFAKMPDGQVTNALGNLDERKAGKVLAALPVDRAARLTALMNRTTATTGQNPASPGSSPAMTVP